jgi:hypothetical protein
MKRLGIIMLLVLCGCSVCIAQKTKVKAASGETAPDSSKANGAGKAAIRGGALMNASRDSLRGKGSLAPKDVVDTFGVKKPVGKSYLHEPEIVKAEVRLKDMQEQILEAEKQLEIAKTEKHFTPEQIAKAQESLNAQKTRVAAVEAKVRKLRKDWEAVTGVVPKEGDTTPK